MLKAAIIGISAWMLLSLPLAIAAKVGEPAPAFTAKDSQGKSHRLSDLKGKFVVLEWHNKGCPYVIKHYGAGNMQKLQKEWTDKGVAWLTVITSPEGQQGHMTGPEADKHFKSENAAPTAVLLDPSGEMGKLFSAKTTPHMYVIDPKGVLVYAGAIDDKPSSDEEDIPGSKNYVAAALTEAMAGKPITVASTRAYGCGVKYAK